MKYLKTKFKKAKEKIKSIDKKKFALQSIPSFALMALATVSTKTMYNDNLSGARKDVKGILAQMSGVIELVFQAVGIVLLVYSIAQLVLAFKNEDADSKTRASTMLVVAVILIAIPQIIKGFDILSYLD